MEKVVDVTAARRQLGTLLDEVFYRGNIFTIKRKGRALAQIVPVGEYGLQAQQKELLAELNSLPHIGIEEDPVEILRRMRKQKQLRALEQYGE